MNYLRTSEISAAGMAAQQARVQAAALNLANMQASIAPGTTGFQPLKALIQPSSFGRTLAAVTLPVVQLVAQTDRGVRTAYDPGHPHADSAGLVAYPDVDQTQEMLTVVEALRSYEANLAALQATKTLAAKALEIGGQ